MSNKSFCLWFTVACLLSACSKAPSPTDEFAESEVQPATQEQIVAQVGPEQITQKQLDYRLRQLDDSDFSFAQTPIGQHNFVQLLVREKLALLDARSKELDKSDLYLTELDEKRKQLQEIYQQYASDLLVRLWEDHLRQTDVLQITDEEIEAYHKKYPYEMSIKQIIIADAQTADIVWRAVKSNKKRWKELEQQYSIAPKYSKGKEISFMPGEFISELEVIAANSPVGSVQGFIKTTQGFHIIMKTGERRLTLQQAAPRIRSVLENKKLDTLFNALQTNYKVMIYEQNN